MIITTNGKKNQILLYISVKTLHNEFRSVDCYVPCEEILLEQADLLVSELYQ